MLKTACLGALIISRSLLLPSYPRNTTSMYVLIFCFLVSNFLCEVDNDMYVFSMYSSFLPLSCFVVLQKHKKLTVIVHNICSEISSQVGKFVLGVGKLGEEDDVPAMSASKDSDPCQPLLKERHRSAEAIPKVNFFERKKNGKGYRTRDEERLLLSDDDDEEMEDAVTSHAGITFVILILLYQPF